MGATAAGGTAWFYTGGRVGPPRQLPVTTPGGYTMDFGVGIDNAGEVAGSAMLSNGYQNPCVYTGGTTYDLPIPQASHIPHLALMAARRSR